MQRALTLLGLAAFASAKWIQVGKTMPEESVTAVSLDFDPDGLPVFAFGYNETGKGTVIPVQAWNGVEWEEDSRRYAQFPQGYHEFNFKVRNFVKYLGIKIHYHFGSVMNGGVEWRGCYAFHNDLFDYEIDSKGNMVMLWVSTKPTDVNYPGTDNKLVLVTYDRSGWTGYPAGPAFGPLIPVAAQNDTVKVTDVKIVRGANADTFVAGYVLGGDVTVFNDSTTQKHLGKPWKGVGLDLVYHKTYGTFVSYMEPGKHVVYVKHLPLGAADWVDLGAAVLSASNKEVKTTLAVTDDGTVVVAAPGSIYASHLHTATFALGSSTSWAHDTFTAAGPITHWDMGAKGFTVFVVLSENNGKGVRVVKSDF